MNKLTFSLITCIFLVGCKGSNCERLFVQRNKSLQERDYEAVRLTDSLIINYCK